VSETPAKVGRPSTRSPEIAKRLCDHVAAGNSVRSFCRVEGNPGMFMIFQWLREDHIFAQHYTQAMEVRAERMFEDMLDIADDTTGDKKTAIKNGKEVELVDFDNIQRSRLRVDTRKWVLSRMNPKKYGERIQNDVTSGGATLDDVIRRSLGKPEPKKDDAK
jgi:hypothetical protein